MGSRSAMVKISRRFELVIPVKLDKLDFYFIGGRDGNGSGNFGDRTYHLHLRFSASSPSPVGYEAGDLCYPHPRPIPGFIIRGFPVPIPIPGQLGDSPVNSGLGIGSPSGTGFIAIPSSGNYLTHVVDADIRPVNDQMPFAEVQLTAQHNVIANEQQHTKQSKPIYDTYLLKKIDSNTTPDSTNISHRGGEID
ncbi:hypothetical protein Tco_1545704 [Tanacetum coccineum]